MRRYVIGACVALTLLLPIAWVGLDNFNDGIDTQDTAEIDNDNQDADSDEDAQILRTLESRGAYLSRAGNCMSCHTQPGGEPYAGGRVFETPFGLSLIHI